MRVVVNAAVFDARPSGLGAYTRDLIMALGPLLPDLVSLTSRPDALPGGHRITDWGEPSRGLRGHLARLIWTQTTLPRLVRRLRASVLLNTLPEGPLRPPTPQVTVVHDILPLFFGREFPKQQWYFRTFVPHVLRASARVIAVSARTRDDVLNAYGLDPARVIIVHPGVDHKRFAPVANADRVTARLGLDRYMLYVGNLLPHKNLDGLLRAFAHVRGDTVLAMAGYRDPRYFPALYTLARRLRIERRVRFLGFVPDAHLPALYTAAIGVVLPSLYEGFGLPVLEAMACGAPVVVANTGGLQEAAGQAAIVVHAESTEELAEALQKLVDDAALRARLRAEGLNRAKGFGWDRTAMRVRAILEDVAHP